jgi:hypothetical protein
MEVCRVQGGSTEGLFTAVSKKPSGRGRPSAEYDYRLTRHACYLVAESADGRKEEVALAKIYFALTTERYELLAQTGRSGCASSIASACSARTPISRCAPARLVP